MHKFAQGLQKRHFVCYIAVMFRIKSDTYDGYELAAMKPDTGCNVTDAEWAAMNVQKVSTNAIALMYEWIPVNIFRRFVSKSITLFY